MQRWIMPSKKLEAYSSSHPSLAPYIQKLEEYIQWLREQGITEVVPRVAAAKLGLSEADALALLSIFRDAGMVRPRYDLICRRTQSTLASFYSLDEIPDEVHCEECGQDHDGDDIRVELVFEITAGKTANAAA
jgi:hypothetical protein